MIQKLVLALLLVVLLSQASLADARWVYSGDTFTIDDVVYSVQSSGDHSRIILGAGSQNYILDMENCRENNVLQERYCITASGLEEDHSSRVKYEAGEELFGYRLEITDIMPELEVSRDISPSPQYNQYSTITVTLTNVGEQTITGIRYTEYINSSLSLDAVDGQREGNNFTYARPSLAPDQSVVFKYRIRPNEHVTTSQQPSISYVFDNQEYSTTVDPFTISLTAPFALHQEVTQPQPLPGEETIYQLTLTNNAQENAQYTIEVQRPEGLQPTSLTNWSEENLQLAVSGELEGEQSVIHEIPFSAIRTGEYPLSTTLRLRAQGEDFTRYYQQVIDTRIQELKPRIQTSRGSGVSGEEMTIRAYYENENDQVLQNIRARLSAPGLEEEFTIERLGSNEDRLVQEVLHILSQVDERTTQTVVLSGTYETIHEEEFTFSTSENIVVRPVDGRYVVTQTPSQETYSPGDVIRVEVSIESDESSYSFLAAEDEIPFPITSGRNQVDISLSTNEERLLYTYDFQIPDNYTQPIPITTTITTRESSSSYTTTLFYEEEVYSGEEEQPQETEPQESEVVEQAEEEQGFFTRMWNFLRGFFTRD